MAVIDKHIADAITNFASDRATKLQRNKEKKARKQENARVLHQKVLAIKAKVEAVLTPDEYNYLLDKTGWRFVK